MKRKKMTIAEIEQATAEGKHVEILPSGEISVGAPFDLHTSLAAKLGSILVHVEEWLSAEGHPFDRTVLEALLKDEEVVEWLNQLRAMAMIPLKRRE